MRTILSALKTVTGGHKIFQNDARLMGVDPTTLLIQKPATSRILLDARGTGLEPATSAVHVIHYFHSGMDYIFTIGFHP